MAVEGVSSLFLLFYFLHFLNFLQYISRSPVGELWWNSRGESALHELIRVCPSTPGTHPAYAYAYSITPNPLQKSNPSGLYTCHGCNVLQKFNGMWICATSACNHVQCIWLCQYIHVIVARRVGILGVNTDGEEATHHLLYRLSNALLKAIHHGSLFRGVTLSNMCKRVIGANSYQQLGCVQWDRCSAYALIISQDLYSANSLHSALLC